jgi:hypothetical protein
MRYILLTTTLLLISTKLVFADKVYIFIDKVGVVDVGQEKGQTSIGDIIQVVPYSPQYEPTQAEKDRCKILVTDLTMDEIDTLRKPKTHTEILQKQITLDSAVYDSFKSDAISKDNAVVINEKDNGATKTLTYQFDTEVQDKPREFSIDLKSFDKQPVSEVKSEEVINNIIIKP